MPWQSPIVWWPRHTPRIGISPRNRRMRSALTPASFGVHGPGEITRWLGRIATASSTDSASLRTTRTSRDRSISPNRCTRLKVNES